MGIVATADPLDAVIRQRLAARRSQADPLGDAIRQRIAFRRQNAEVFQPETPQAATPPPAQSLAGTPQAPMIGMPGQNAQPGPRPLDPRVQAAMQDQMQQGAANQPFLARLGAASQPYVERSAQNIEALARQVPAVGAGLMRGSAFDALTAPFATPPEDASVLPGAVGADPAIAPEMQAIGQNAGTAANLAAGIVTLPAQMLDPEQAYANLAGGLAAKGAGALLAGPVGRLGRLVAPRTMQVAEPMLEAAAGVGTFSGVQAAKEGASPLEALQQAGTGALTGALTFGLPIGVAKLGAGKFAAARAAKLARAEQARAVDAQAFRDAGGLISEAQRAANPDTVSPFNPDAVSGLTTEAPGALPDSFPIPEAKPPAAGIDPTLAAKETTHVQQERLQEGRPQGLLNDRPAAPEGAGGPLKETARPDGISVATENPQVPEVVNPEYKQAPLRTIPEPPPLGAEVRPAETRPTPADTDLHGPTNVTETSPKGHAEVTTGEQVPGVVTPENKPTRAERKKGRLQKQVVAAPGTSFQDSPAGKQYASFKAKHPDAVLMFRLGDFYEMFGDDAVKASKTLGLTLTQRSGVQMAGIPYHSLEKSLQGLVKGGHRVAVAEQVSGKLTKGAKIERVVTPGTLADDAALAPVSAEKQAAKVGPAFRGAFDDFKSAIKMGDETKTAPVAEASPTAGTIAFGNQMSTSETGYSKSLRVMLNDADGKPLRSVEILKSKYRDEWVVREHDGYDQIPMGSQKIAKSKYKEYGAAKDLRLAKIEAEAILRGKDTTKTAAELMRPFEELKPGTGNDGWRGTLGLAEGESSPFMSDGTAMVRRADVGAKDAAAMDKVTPQAVRAINPSAMQDVWDGAIADSKVKGKPAKIVGQVPWVEGPVAYLESADGSVVYVNGNKLALLTKATGADGYRVTKPNKPVVLTKGEKPVGVVMPMNEPNARKQWERPKTAKSPNGAAATSAASKLDTIASAAKDRIKKRTIKRGKNTGATTLFDDAVDAAVYIAAKAGSAGIRGGAKLSKFVRQHLTEFGDDLASSWGQVRRIAKGILDDSHDGDRFDPDLFERAVGDAQSVANPETRASLRKQIGEEIKARTGAGRLVAKTITEPQALKAGLRKAQRASLAAYREGRTHAREELAFSLDELAGRLREDAGRRRAMGRLQARSEAGKERGLVKAETATGIRAEVRRLVEEHVPAAKRGKFLPDIDNAKTIVQLNRAITKIRNVVAESQIRADIKQVNRLGGKKRLLKLADTPDTPRVQEAQKAITAAKGAAADPTIDAPRRAELVRDALNALKRVHHDQKTENVIYVSGRKKTAARERKAIVAAVQKAKELPGTRDTPAERKPGFFKSIGYNDMTPETLAMTIDGDFSGRGPVARYLYNTFVQAKRVENQTNRDFIRAVDELAKKHGYEGHGDFMAKVGGSLGELSQEKVNVPLGGAARITKGQAMYILALDPATRIRARRGQTFNFMEDRNGKPFKLTDDTFRRIEEALTPKERKLVEDLKALYDDRFFDPLNRTSMRMNGHRLDKIKGYWGIKRNMGQSDKVGQAAGWRGHMAAHLENTSMLKEREGGRMPILIGNFANELIERARSASKVIQTAESVRAGEMTLLHPETTVEVAKRFGPQAVDRMKLVLRDVAGGLEDAGERFQRPVRWLTGNVGAALTQVNPKTWLRQLGGVARIVSELKRDGVTSGEITSSMGALKGGKQKLVDLSPVFWERYTRGNQGVFEAVRGTKEGGEVGAGRAAKATMRQLVDSAQNVGRLRGGDALRSLREADKPWRQLKDTWDWGNWFDEAPARVALSAYEKAAARRFPKWTAERRQEWAVRRTERAFMRTANTNDVLHQSEYARRGRQNALLGSFLQFTSDNNKARNMLYRARKLGPAEFTVTALGIAASWAWSAAVVTGGANYGLRRLNRAIHGQQSGETDKADAMAAAGQRLIQEAASIVPLGGRAVDLYDSLQGRGGTSDILGAPITQVADLAIRAGQDLMKIQDELDKDPEKAKGLLPAVERFTRALESGGKAGMLATGAPAALVGDASGLLKARKSDVLTQFERAATEARAKAKRLGASYQTRSLAGKFDDTAQSIADVKYKLSKGYIEQSEADRRIEELAASALKRVSQSRMADGAPTR